MADGTTEEISMGNDELKILDCRIPAFSQQVTLRRAQRLADYPLARASEWAPLAASPVPFGGDENEDLFE